MASLNRRVANKAIIASELKIKTPLLLSDDFLATVDKCIGADFLTDPTLSNDLRAATTLDAQVNVLKQKVEDELSLENEVQTSHALRYMVVVYLNLPSKSSLKARLLKILKVWLEKDDFVHIHNYLSEHLHEIVSSTVSSGRLVSCPSLKNIVSLLEYFEKTPSLLMRSYPSVVEYVQKLFNFDVKNGIIFEASSLSRLSLYECIHDGVRALLLIMHSVSNKCDDKIVDETLCDKEFLSIIDSFIHHPELPLDTKLNCGLLSMRIIHKTGGAVECVKTFRGKCLTDQNQNSIAKICYCSPLLNIFTVQELKSLKFNESNLVSDDSLFQSLYQLLFKMSDDFATDSNIILALNRTIEQLAICLANKSSVHVTLDVAQLFLNYILTHSEHFMDAVKHRTKCIFEHFITFGELSKVNVVYLTLESLSKAKMTSKFFCVGIQLLSTRVKTDLLLQRFPKFIETYIQAIQETPASTTLVTAFNLVMTEQFKCEDLDKWVSMWVDPVLEAINRNDSPALEQVLSRAIQIEPLIIKTLFSREKKLPLYLSLLCVYLGTKNGLDINEVIGHAPGVTDAVRFETTWNKAFGYFEFHEAQQDPNEKVRLLAFQLVTETKKTTEYIYRDQFDFVLSTLKENLNTQSPAFRQKILSHLKKFILWFKKRCSDQKETYASFRQKLAQLCADNLFPFANFERRCFALNILKICFDANIFDELQIQKTFRRELLLHLNDSYEENKAMALYMLTFGMKYPVGFQKKTFKGPMSEFKLFQACKKLASSTHPSDCVTAAYYLEFFIKSEKIISLSNVSPDCSSEAKRYFHQMGLELEKQVQTAENNILEAAVNGPIYGVLHVIKHLLSRLDLQFANDDAFWVPFLLKVVELSFRASSAVSQVVNNVSPEGHLPMDFTVVNRVEEEADTDETTVTHATSQLLLLCAWRTTKAVSLFFGEIMERTLIVGEGTDGLMTEELVLRIGSYFIQSLSEIKHRGAFEQAYVGFSKVCLILWKCPNKVLSKLPELWLEEMMTEITAASDKLCSTRRSAGLPFIIQALLVAEHQLSPSSNCFHSTMNQLLKLCEAEEANSESKIHALNILRSLFRSTELGDQVNTYVAQAVKIAVLGFSASSWSERNSSTLLLSALLVRIFGVPRSKDMLSWKNKMTGRIFFLRYPSLYEFFLQQLQEFDSNLANLEITSTNELRIFPILLVLSRIYPSSLEGTDSNLQLTNYLKYIRGMSKSRIHAVRVLAADALASFVSTSNWQESFDCSFDDLQSTEVDNVRHGILLQLIQIVLKLIKIPKKTQLYLEDKIEAAFPTFLSRNVSSVVKDSFIKFAFYATSKWNYRTEDAVLINLCTQIAEGCKSDQNIIGKKNFDVTATLFILYNLTIHQKPYKKEMDDVAADLSKLTLEEISRSTGDINFLDCVLFFMNSSEFDVMDTVLNFIFYLLLLSNDLNVEFNLPKNEQEDLHAFPVINHGTKFFHQVFSVLKESQRSKIQSISKALLDSKIFCERLTACLEASIANDKHHLLLHKYLAILRFVPTALKNYCNSSKPALENLSKFCFKDNDESLTVQALHCIWSYLVFENRAEQKLNNQAKNFSRETKTLLADLVFSREPVSCYSDQIRFAIAQIIGDHYLLILQIFSEVTTIKLMFTISDLMMDDLASIRIMMGKTCQFWKASTFNCMLEYVFANFKSKSEFGNFNFTLACVAWMVKDVDYTVVNENQEKTFNKTDMNAYHENILLARNAAYHLETIFSRRHRIDKVPIPEEVVDYLWSYCNLSMEKCFTIFDLFKAVVNEDHSRNEKDINLYISTVLDSNLSNYDSKKILSNYKIKLIKPLYGKLLKKENNV